MPENRTPVVAGLGGAALVAAALSFAGHGPTTSVSPNPTAPTTVLTADALTELASDQNGPWYAFCHEYATDEFDHGTDPTKERGLKGHQIPAEADAGSVEVTRKISDTEQEKFNVTKHLVGDLPSCVVPDTDLRVAIAIVTSQFPAIAQFAFSFFKPVLSAIH